MRKRSKRIQNRIFLWALVLLLPACFPGSAAAQPTLEQIQAATSAQELLEIYSGADNAIVRQQAIQALGRVVGDERVPGLAKSQPAQTNAAEADTTAVMLHQGLADPSISVVRESVYQIGNLRLRAFATELSDMFYDADRRFPGSQKEIQAEIITALGKIGGTAAQGVFNSVLAKGMANYRTEKVLVAVAQMNDPAMTGAVTAYAEDIETVLLKMPDTPENRLPRMRYRRALDHARRVQQQLSEN